MEITNNATPKGVFALRILDADGNTLEQYEDRNLVVTAGRSALGSLLGAGTPGKVVNRFQAGTNGSTAVLGDTAIVSPFTKAVSGVSYPSGGVQFAFSVELSEANGTTIREFGLLCTDNTLFARIVRAPIIKDNTIRIEATWTVTF